MTKGDGMNYAPEGKPNPVVTPGEFVFAAVHLDHGHIYGQCNGLIEAGATLKWVYDPDPAKVDAFREKFSQVKVTDSLDAILEDQEVHLVAAAAIPCERGPLGCRVMNAVARQACVADTIPEIMRVRYGDGLDLSYYERPGHERDPVFDTRRIQEELGFVPMKMMSASADQ